MLYILNIFAFTSVAVVSCFQNRCWLPCICSAYPVILVSCPSLPITFCYSLPTLELILTVIITSPIVFFSDITKCFKELVFHIYCQLCYFFHLLISSQCFSTSCRPILILFSCYSFNSINVFSCTDVEIIVTPFPGFKMLSSEKHLQKRNCFLHTFTNNVDSQPEIIF